jgi:hypothetical protein
VSYIVASYGGGTNSKALACEMVRRGEQLDALTFSVTGGERPEVYADIEHFSAWLLAHGYPPIQILRREPAKVGDRFASTLEEECLLRGQLPSVAYGFKSCSDKWKLQPFRKWLKAQGQEDVTVLIGFDADEPQRAKAGEKYTDGYARRYPLIEWGWGREECVAAIESAGLPQPGKSACFFCPNSKPREIVELNANHPDLMSRALAIEAGADLTTLRGLGRNWSWADVVRSDIAQVRMFQSEMPCECYDGEAA